MTAPRQAEGVGLGFRVKTGRAIAVVLAGPDNAPKALARRELLLSDEADPESFQPYHAGLELPPSEAEAVVHHLSEIVRRVSSAALQEIVDELRRSNREPRGAAIVVGSLADPDTIKNPHLHAHAAEGRLFFESVAAALERLGLPPSVHAEKDIYVDAAKVLRVTEGTLDRTVVAMGKALGKPWRMEEKAAALAAWVALSG